MKTARRVVIEAVKKHSATSSVSLEESIQDLRLGHYDFLFPRGKKNRPYYCYPDNYSTPYHQTNNPYGVTYNGVTDEASGWDLVGGAIITRIVMGPLHWFRLTECRI